MTLATGVKNLSDVLKNKIDEVSPELAQVRARYKKIFDSKDSFLEGTKLLGMNADQAE